MISDTVLDALARASASTQAKAPRYCDFGLVHACFLSAIQVRPIIVNPLRATGCNLDCRQIPKRNPWNRIFEIAEALTFLGGLERVGSLKRSRTLWRVGWRVCLRRKMDSKITFTSRDFRDALGLLPTGVTVVSARSAGGELLGITVNSFTSVSLEPPLISFCLAKSVRSLEEFRKVESFAVNILREDQREISLKFAQSDDNKWSEVNYRTSARSNPILEPNLAVFECKHQEEYEGGDHVIVVGHVLNFETDTQERPLIFFRGRYSGVNQA